MFMHSKFRIRLHQEVVNMTASLKYGNLYIYSGTSPTPGLLKRSQGGAKGYHTHKGIHDIVVAGGAKLVLSLNAIPRVSIDTKAGVIKVPILAMNKAMKKETSADGVDVPTFFIYQQNFNQDSIVTSNSNIPYMTIIGSVGPTGELLFPNEGVDLAKDYKLGNLFINIV